MNYLSKGTIPFRYSSTKKAGIVLAFKSDY